VTNAKEKRPLMKVAIATAGLVAALTIAACGSTGGTDNSDVPTAQGGKASGTLNVSNWPLYIDEETVNDFEKKTGIKVNYTEDVNSNTDFFGKVQPLLSNGDSGGRSILVVTDWMSQKMWDLGYLQKLDPNELTTVFDNLIPSLQDPAFDPGRGYSIPWQSGMTGLVVRTDLAPDIKSVNDLFDPKYKGKITMLDELRDSAALVM
jgi:spermidine/putrescine transport system substrate-binding protein